MIHFFYGNSDEKKMNAVRTARRDFLKRNPNAVAYTVARDADSSSRLEDLLSSAGLFGEPRIITCEDLCGTKKSNEDEDGDAETPADGVEEFFITRARDLETSPHCFIVREKTAGKKLIAALEAAGATLQKFSGDKKRDFSSFALADALGERDKKKMWVLLQKEIRKETDAENIIGTLFWKVKMMALAASGASAADAGVAPFALWQAATHAKLWSADELRALSSSLMRLFHDGRKSEGGAYTALEAFVLNIA